MSRRPTDDDTPLPPYGAIPADVAGHLPCNACGTPTRRADLSLYGARCFRCFRSWCAAPQPRPAFMGDKRKDPKSWAHALKSREEAGERLSPVQKTMWREALRNASVTGDEA